MLNTHRCGQRRCDAASRECAHDDRLTDDLTRRRAVRRMFCHRKFGYARHQLTQHKRQQGKSCAIPFTSPFIFAIKAVSGALGVVRKIVTLVRWWKRGRACDSAGNLSAGYDCIFTIEHTVDRNAVACAD